MTRRELREHCFKMLFCADFYPAEEKEEQLERDFGGPLEDITTPEDVMCRIAELDERIDVVTKGWTTRRMGKVELTILRLALYEMLYDEEVPEKVAINEAVELAKKFGGDDAPSFINGVLAKLV